MANYLLKMIKNVSANYFIVTFGYIEWQVSKKMGKERRAFNS